MEATSRKRGKACTIIEKAPVAAEVAPKGVDGRPYIKKTLTDGEKAIVIQKILDVPITKKLRTDMVQMLPVTSPESSSYRAWRIPEAEPN